MGENSSSTAAPGSASATTGMRMRGVVAIAPDRIVRIGEGVEVRHNAGEHFTILDMQRANL
jgi:hypothetical protein